MTVWMFNAWKDVDGIVISTNPILSVNLANDLELNAEYVETGFDLLVTVLNNQGNPVQGAAVAGIGPTSPVATLTDFNGQILFQGLSSGSYRFEASWSANPTFPIQTGFIVIDPSLVATAIINLSLRTSSLWLFGALGLVGLSAIMYSSPDDRPRRKSTPKKRR